MSHPDNIKICDKCGEAFESRGIKQHRNSKQCKWNRTRKMYESMGWTIESNKAIINWVRENMPEHIERDYVDYNNYRRYNNLRVGHWISSEAKHEAEKRILRGFTTIKSRKIIDRHNEYVFIEINDEIKIYRLIDPSCKNRKVKVKSGWPIKIYDVNGRLLGKITPVSSIKDCKLKQELEQIKVAHKL